MPGELDEFVVIEARRASGLMKKRLMSAAGGSCIVKVANVTRILSHRPWLDGPPTRLPWPLSKLQPHELGYAELQGEQSDGQERRFKGSQVDAAVQHFLRGVDPSEEVQIFTDGRA